MQPEELQPKSTEPPETMCPRCLVSLDGEDMIEAYVKLGYPQEKAKELAIAHGYRERRTKFSRRVAISNGKFFVGWACPDCELTLATKESF